MPASLEVKRCDQSFYFFMLPLKRAFYLDADVAELAKMMVGKYLVSRLGGNETILRITETEAYAGEVDKASHAFAGKRTARTEVMFGQGGTAYVYLCYGMHHLLNVVTNRAGIPHAVLIRAGMPVKGEEVMMQRMNRSKADKKMTIGPGNVAKAMGVQKIHSGFDLTGDDLFLSASTGSLSKTTLMVSPRIGVDYAGAAARWYYRFFEKDSPYVTPHALNKVAIQLYSIAR